MSKPITVALRILGVAGMMMLPVMGGSRFYLNDIILSLPS